MSKHSFNSEPSDNTTLVSALGWVGVFLVFVLVVAITYLRDPATSQEQNNVVERFRIRNEMQAKQVKLVKDYQWVNEPEARSNRLNAPSLRVLTQMVPSVASKIAPTRLVTRLPGSSG